MRRLVIVFTTLIVLLSLAGGIAVFAVFLAAALALLVKVLASMRRTSLPAQ